MGQRLALMTLAEISCYYFLTSNSRLFFAEQQRWRIQRARAYNSGPSIVPVAVIVPEIPALQRQPALVRILPQVVVPLCLCKAIPQAL